MSRSQKATLLAAQEAEKNRFKWVTEPGRSVPNAKIAAILLDSKYNGGSVDETTYLLLKDGSVYADLMDDFGGTLAQKAEAAPKKAPPTPKTGFALGLVVPRVKPGQSARGVFKELRAKTEEAAITQPDMMKVVPVLKELEKQAPALLQGIEKGLLTQCGFAPRDMGTAYAMTFLSLHESATGQKTSDAQDKAAGRTLSSAIGQFWAPKWKTLTPAAKEQLYESLIMSSALTLMIIEQFTLAKRDDEVATLRATAGETFEKLVGVSPENVKIAADGRIFGLSEK